MVPAATAAGLDPLCQATDQQIGRPNQVLAGDPVQAVGPLACARVDVVPTSAGSVLMEFELIEPLLCFGASDGSADRAACAWQPFLASAGWAPSVEPSA
jgi:hypothetical protein